MKLLLLITLIIAFVARGSYGTSLLYYNESQKFCDLYTSTPQCDPNVKYRPFDGVCNNLLNPKWGAVYNVYQRVLSPRFKDGKFQVIESVKGGPLPSARKLSLELFSKSNTSSDIFTLILPQFGQLVAEDGGMTAVTNKIAPCCLPDGTVANPPDPMCDYIPLDSSDPTQSIMARTCMDFIRTTTDLDSNCPGYNNNGAANPINAQTSYADLSGIYGSDAEENKNLRTHNNGLLKTVTTKGEEFPEYMTKETSICPEDNPTGKCFLSGDFRINENPGLTTVYITFIREHNRIARELKQINPHWCDERLFQEARRINIAQYQYIVYHQYFAEFIGKWFMRKNLLIYHDKGDDRVDDYDPTVNANMVAEHATAAHRYFHTMVQDILKLVSKQETVVGGKALKDFFFRASVVQTDNVMEQLARGMCREAAGAADNFHPEAIHDFLFNGGAALGADLKAIDIQRGRDHGLGSYNDAREYCGLPRATTWTGFADEIPQTDIDKMKLIYKDPEDVELAVGAALEREVADAVVGKTFQCLIARQLHNSRVGDRFWFETSDPKLKFTSEQLAEIRKASLARIFCDTGKSITRMQRNVFRLPSNENPIVGCNFIPKVNLRKWKE